MIYDRSGIKASIFRGILVGGIYRSFIARNQVSSQQGAHPMKVVIAIEPLNLFSLFCFVGGIERHFPAKGIEAFVVADDGDEVGFGIASIQQFFMITRDS